MVGGRAAADTPAPLHPAQAVGAVFVLDSVRERVVSWPDEQPSPTVVVVLERPREIDPERFKPAHERMVQRFVKARRAAMAREVLLGTLPPTITSELPAEAV